MSIEINGAGTITGVDSLSTPAVTNAAGSASSPSITFTGDTNTGLYSPGADQVAVTTGGTARLFVDASGRLLVSTSTSRNDFFNGTTTVAGGIQLELSASDNLNRFMSFTSNNSDTGGPSFLFGKSRGTTANSKTVVQSDDQLAAFNFHGADGSDMVEAARISAHVDGTPGANDMPGRLVFSTTADGASSPTERMRIDAKGHVTIYKDASNLARLHLNGSSTRLEYSDSSGDLTFYTNTSGRVQVGYTGGFRPVTDNSQALGTSGQRSTAVFAVNETIQTSDLR